MASLSFEEQAQLVRTAELLILQDKHSTAAVTLFLPSIFTVLFRIWLKFRFDLELWGNPSNTYIFSEPSVTKSKAQDVLQSSMSNRLLKWIQAHLGYPNNFTLHELRKICIADFSARIGVSKEHLENFALVMRHSIATATRYYDFIRSYLVALNAQRDMWRVRGQAEAIPLLFQQSAHAHHPRQPSAARYGANDGAHPPPGSTAGMQGAEAPHAQPDIVEAAVPAMAVGVIDPRPLPPIPAPNEQCMRLLATLNSIPHHNMQSGAVQDFSPSQWPEEENRAETDDEELGQASLEPLLTRAVLAHAHSQSDGAGVAEDYVDDNDENADHADTFTVNDDNDDEDNDDDDDDGGGGGGGDGSDADADYVDSRKRGHPRSPLVTRKAVSFSFSSKPHAHQRLKRASRAAAQASDIDSDHDEAAEVELAQQLSDHDIPGEARSFKSGRRMMTQGQRSGPSGIASHHSNDIGAAPAPAAAAAAVAAAAVRVAGPDAPTPTAATHQPKHLIAMSPALRQAALDAIRAVMAQAAANEAPDVAQGNVAAPTVTVPDLEALLSLLHE